MIVNTTQIMLQELGFAVRMQTRATGCPPRVQPHEAYLPA